VSDKTIMEAVEDAMWQSLDADGGRPHSGVDPAFVVTEFLELLAADGIVLVKLPEKLGEDCPYWRTLIGGEPEDVYPSPFGEIVISGAARVDSADEARGLAAALLAAAIELEKP